MYQCSPDEPAGINDLRKHLQQKFPDKALPVGRHFILYGEPAFQALSAYYQALVDCETLSNDLREYAGRRFDAVKIAHVDSQSLPIPIDLTEGQLSQDELLKFYTCVAIRNGQVGPRPGD